MNMQRLGTIPQEANAMKHGCAQNGANQEEPLMISQTNPYHNGQRVAPSCYFSRPFEGLLFGYIFNEARWSLRGETELLGRSLFLIHGMRQAGDFARGGPFFDDAFLCSSCQLTDGCLNHG